MTAVHFRVNPCRSPYEGTGTADPDAVTCEDCKPVAAKYRRAAALQLFEEAVVACRRISALWLEAQRNADALASERKHALNLLVERRDAIVTAIVVEP